VDQDVTGIRDAEWAPCGVGAVNVAQYLAEQAGDARGR
jgi:hypothetical protein